MAADLDAIRALFLLPARLWRSQRSRRHGTRCAVGEKGRLWVSGRAYPGVIENVALSGIYFKSPEVPAGISAARLTGPDGRSVDVNVVWHRNGDGVGLAFAPAAPR